MILSSTFRGKTLPAHYITPLFFPAIPPSNCYKKVPGGIEKPAFCFDFLMILLQFLHKFIDRRVFSLYNDEE